MRIPLLYERFVARGLDLGMCAAMNAVQLRHRLPASSRADLERYIAQCELMSRADFFAVPGEIGEFDFSQSQLEWSSPVRSGYPRNDRARADLYPCAKPEGAPTVLLLHALMSASDLGYRAWARKFNARGWNAIFVHLPFHYSRVPRGFFNGELAISADLVRTSEGLRQGVIELRQLMRALRGRGVGEFGLWASSYGGWIGALLLAVEADFRFAALMEPIVNVEHAIWECAASHVLRRQLRRHQITQSLVERHFHLTSPLHAKPLLAPSCVILAAGEYDQIARMTDVEELNACWRDAELIRIRQGHFGYRMMPAVFARLLDRGWLESAYF